MPRRKFLRELFGFAATQYVVRAVMMVRGILAARLLGPQAYGAWNALQIMMDYGAFASSGTLQGLDQMVPSRLVAQDSEGANRIKRAALANILFATALFSAGCVLWASKRSSRILDEWGIVGILVALGCVWCINAAAYKLSILRSHERMNSVSRWFVVQSIIGVPLGLALTPLWGMWGLLIGWFIGCLASLITVAHDARDVALHWPRFSMESLRLVRTGFPMFVHSVGGLAMRSIDRIIILRFLGTESLGHYSVSVMGLTLLMYLPDSITYVLYPRMLRRYSQEENGQAAIRDLALRVIQVMAVVVPLLSGIGYLWAREMVSVALPRFLPGVTAVRILCFGAVGLAVANLSALVLMTVGRRLWLVPAAAFSIVLGISLDVLVLQLGHGISGVAVATLVTFVSSGGLLLSLALISTGVSAVRIPWLVARMMATLPLGIALAWACDRFMPWAEPPNTPLRVLRLVLATAVFASVYLTTASVFARGIGLQSLMTEFEIPVLSPLLRRLGWVSSPPKAGA